VEVIKDFEAKTGSQICEGYGLSETSPVVTTNPYGERRSRLHRPAGFDTDIKIVDYGWNQGDAGGELGDLGQRTPGHQRVLQDAGGDGRDPPGRVVLHPATSETMDAEGYFYIVDRKKDMVIAGGYNIYPRRSTRSLRHPKILEACAVGIPDPYRGETIKASGPETGHRP
jgi:long-chain acyl-CoA synthetase